VVYCMTVTNKTAGGVLRDSDTEQTLLRGCLLSV